MTGAERTIKAAQRAGKPVTAAMTCATITSLPELDAYRVGLSQRGALDTDAMAAIRGRQDEIREGRG